MLPDIVRVKISSEAAESISLTPVVVQELAFAELLDHIVTVTGKDAPRIREVLLRGGVIASGSRFRWTAVQVSADDILPLLARYPDPDPSLPFRAERCMHVILRGGPGQVMLPKDVAQKRHALQKRSYWDVLMDLAASGPLEYIGYSYRERADRYRVQLLSTAAAELSRSADLLSHDALRNQIRAAALSSAEFRVER